MSSRDPSSDISQSRLWSSFSSAYFVPLSEIERYTKRSKNSCVLEQSYCLQLNKDVLLERTLATATRLYCVLLYIGQVDLLPKLLSIDFNDSKLSISDRSVLLDLQAAIVWNQSLLEQFLEAQWLFFAPCFEGASSTLILLPKIPIPLVYEALETKTARKSVIHQVQIHEAHQRFFKPTGVSEKAISFEELRRLILKRLLAMCWHSKGLVRKKVAFQERARGTTGFE